MTTDHEGMIPSLKERDMNEFSKEVRELDIDQLDGVSGGEIALDAAVNAYLALQARLAAAVQGPSTTPKVSLHF